MTERFINLAGINDILLQSATISSACKRSAPISWLAAAQRDADSGLVGHLSDATSKAATRPSSAAKAHDAQACC